MSEWNNIHNCGACVHYALHSSYASPQMRPGPCVLNPPGQELRYIEPLAPNSPLPVRAISSSTIFFRNRSLFFIGSIWRCSPSPFFIHRSWHMSSSKDGISPSIPAPCAADPCGLMYRWLAKMRQQENGHEWLMAYAAGPGRQIEKEIFLRFDMWGKSARLHTGYDG